MHVLVTGGAGYIGSHLVRALLRRGNNVTVLDDLSSGHRNALPNDVELVVGNCGDPVSLGAAARKSVPDCVMHCAASCSVSESMEFPGRYYRNNVINGLRLLDWMATHAVPWIIHSSSCSVYGTPAVVPIDEQTCPRPINVYGATKLTIDEAINLYSETSEMRGITLRYFNSAGADESGEIGEDKIPASNLIPAVMRVALGQSKELQVFGTDYPSADGTAVRDYVHVNDLCRAHVAALEALALGHSGGVFNLGTGIGHSVLEVVEAAREVTGRELPICKQPRRSGDAAVLVSASNRAHRELDWMPAVSDITRILTDAWRWHSRHPHGFGSGQ